MSQVVMMMMMMIVDYGGRVHIPAMKRLRDVDLVDRGGLISPSGMLLTVRRRERCAERERKSAAFQRSGDFARSKVNYADAQTGYAFEN